MKTSLSLFAGLLIAVPVVAQPPSAEDQKVLGQQRTDLVYLASDAMEGRETGEPGEMMAAGYIAGRFHQLGLEPAGEQAGFFQRFSFKVDGELGENNALRLNSKEFKPKADWYPLAQSASGEVTGQLVKVGKGISAPDLKHDDYKGRKDLKGKVFAIEYTLPDADNPHSDFAAPGEINRRIELAVEKGAAAIIFYNPLADGNKPPRKLGSRAKRVDIPVVFAQGLAPKLIMDASSVEVNVSTDIFYKEKTGRNVIARINNNSATTVVIGGHYDHLGFGHEGSLHRGPRAIHNGADDNASGIAIMLTLAEYFSQSEYKGHNYVFMAFSGEEMGLLGSNYFCKYPTIPLGEISYMINMDMVGRLDPDTKKLAVNGVGTSPVWKEEMQQIGIDGMDIKTGESGIGPSDHTSFYLKDIPVLQFFSGTHGDYHKPSDDAELINYAGMLSITKYIAVLVERLDGKGKIPFTKTKEDNSSKAPRFTVTLGVIPDYMFDGEGMRIDGVTEGKPASNAGIENGDVVIQMGDLKVVDMMSYMKGLSQYKKGETTQVKVKRGEKVMDFDVKF